MLNKAHFWLCWFTGSLQPEELLMRSFFLPEEGSLLVMCLLLKQQLFHFVLLHTGYEFISHCFGNTLRWSWAKTTMPNTVVLVAVLYSLLLAINLINRLCWHLLLFYCFVWCRCAVLFFLHREWNHSEISNLQVSHLIALFTALRFINEPMKFEYY